MINRQELEQGKTNGVTFVLTKTIHNVLVTYNFTFFTNILSKVGHSLLHIEDDEFLIKVHLYMKIFVSILYNIIFLTYSCLISFKIMRLLAITFLQ